MITCKRCGRPAPMGLASCQYCGMPLTNTASDGPDSSMPSDMAPRMNPSDQPPPELPAWLETLRSGERPNTPASGAPNFSASDLIDEGMLPGWMRPERPDMADNSPSGKYPAYPGRRPASMPAPNTDSAFLPNKGMSASSLIDEQSLPSWLQEKQEASQYGAQENIAASSLVQPDALPDWMKKMQPQSLAPASPNPTHYAQPVIPPQGITGNDLIDQQALPQWMSSQDTSASNRGQAGLAGSSLFDASAVPSWLREANQQPQPGSNSSPSFPPPGPGQMPPGQLPDNRAAYNQTPQMPTMNGGLSASSFVDVNALPDWLRPAEDQRQSGAFQSQQQGFAQQPGQAPFGVPGAPARPDNVRVPSRPRGEVGAHEESEVAANVFASVLGVASASPQFPGQRDAYGRSQVPPQPQQNIAQQPLGVAMPGTYNAPGMPPGYVGMPPAQGNMQMPGGYPVGNLPGGPAAGMPPQQQAPANVAGMQPGPSMQNNDMPKQNAKPARRGFLSTILDWFTR